MPIPSPSYGEFLTSVTLESTQSCLTSIRANKSNMTNKQWKKLGKIYKQLADLQQELVSHKPKV